MNKDFLKIRKIVLLASCGLLLLVCILQIAADKRNTVKVFDYSETPDEIVIENGGETVSIKKFNDEWLIGNQRYVANEGAVDSILSALKSVKALDKVGNTSTEANLMRYDLTDGKKITVIAKNGEKVLRKITVGKTSVTGSQSYVTVDDSKDIYLASGNLQNTFNKTAESLRSNTVWTLNKDMIGSIAIKNQEGSEWTLSRTGIAENIEWKIDGHGIVTGEVDASKATAWFGEFASLSAAKWLGDSAVIDGKLLLVCEIECGGTSTALTLYETKAASGDSPAEYAAVSTSTPYGFELAEYSVRKFLKNPGELLK